MPDSYDAGKVIYLLSLIDQTCEAIANKKINANYGHDRVKGYIAEAMQVLQAETIAETAVRLEAEAKDAP